MSSGNLAVPALVPVFHRRAFRFWKNLSAATTLYSLTVADFAANLATF
jgi:hypothetical protein